MVFAIFCRLRPMDLQGKKILVGVTGSIAAYKSALLVRELITSGAEVRVVMTASAIDFITPLTLATLSKNPVQSDFTQDKNAGTWTNHVETGMWPDLMLIAPASANTLAKMANGTCDNFLMAVILSAKCPVMVAPAMDLDMMAHAATIENLNLLTQRGTYVIEAAEGELASGLVGKGRMAEPADIVRYCFDWFLERAPLRGKRFLVTAGPTHEPIDPVRYIGNRSSGKMGFAIANELASRGATVELISGPCPAWPLHSGITKTSVETAAHMAQETNKRWPESDAAICAAAVADFTPTHPAEAKIKKEGFEGTLHLKPTEDILAALGTAKKPGQILVGFALETDDAEANARKKLTSKNADMIVLNSLKDEGVGFGSDTNKITLLTKEGEIFSFEMKSKQAVAVDIIDKISTLLPS